MIHDDVLGSIGQTPMVRLERAGAGLECELLAKLESANPGGSAKDRTAAFMVAEAERSGRLRAGGTVVCATGGNMGVSLAMVAAARGYHCRLAVGTDVSEDRVSAARALGAEVEVCPVTEPDDPRSRYAVARSLAAQTDGAVLVDQWDDPANPEAHYASTGPELWEQTGGAVDAVVGVLGTGGSLCGAGRFVKEQKPDVLVVGVDTEGSVYHDAFHGALPVPANAGASRRIEGMGGDVLPGTLDLDVLDDVIRVGAREAFLAARRLAREEGILTAGNGGACLVAARRLAHDLPDGSRIVILLPERGERALGTVHDDDWMRAHGFLPGRGELTARQLLARKHGGPHELVTLAAASRVADAITVMRDLDVSQIPVERAGSVVGTLREDQIIDLLLHAPEDKERAVEEIMEDPLPEVDGDTGVEALQQLFVSGRVAVLVRDADSGLAILTKYDLIHGLATG